MKNFLTVFLAACLSAGTFAQQTIYVSPDGEGDGTISSPIDLQAALDLAVSNGEDDVLYLTEGAYDNTPYTINYSNGDDQDIAISGSWNLDYTTQSFDPNSTYLAGNNSNQCLSVNAEGAEVSSTLEIKYLLLSEGYTTESHGAGIFIQTGNPTQSNIHLQLEEVLFYNCLAENQKSGGGLFTTSTFEIASCVFSECSAYNGGAIFAGISSFMPDEERIIRNTVFSANSNYGNQGSTIWTNCRNILIEDTDFNGVGDDNLSGNGGCVNVDAGGFAIFNRCVFDGIRINYWGAAIHSWNSSLAVYNSLFHNNHSGELTGFGAISYYHNNDMTDRTHEIVNCTFVNNTNGFGFYTDIHYRGIGGDQLEVSNSIFWGNSNTSLFRESGTATISHSIAQSAPVNFTELSPTSQVDPLLDTNFAIGSGSPAVDEGSNDFTQPEWFDLSGGKRFLGASVDIGCEEFNSPPEGVELSVLDVDENNTADLAFSVASATGQDGDDHTFESILGEGGIGTDYDQFYFTDDVLYILPSTNFEEQSSYSMVVMVTDSEGQSTTVEFEIEVNDINEPPVFVANPEPQSGIVEEPDEFSVEESIVFDEDMDDELTYSALLSDDSALPDWLSFESESITFSGTPDEVNTYEIKLIVTDLGGLTAESTFTYTILSVGMDENGRDILNVYPNPAIETLRIDPYCEGQNHFTVLDVLGKTLLAGSVSCANAVIDVKPLPSGVYLLLLDNPESPGIARFEKH